MSRKMKIKICSTGPERNNLKTYDTIEHLPQKEIVKVDENNWIQYSILHH